MEHARAATAADAHAVSACLHALRDEVDGARGGGLWTAREARQGCAPDDITALLAREDATVVVGTIDDVVVGTGIAEFPTLRDGRRLAVITDLWVDPDARAVGVGEHMVARLIEVAQAHDCIGIDASALPGQRATKNFFEGQGFTARLLTMHRSLDGHGSDPAQ